MPYLDTMTDPATVVRPVPRWVRAWAVATLLLAAAVVILGGLVTSFRVGMSDPVWPTEPWFLVVNNHVWAQEPARGFLIEHTHRLVAWAIGAFTTVLAIGAWASEPNRKLRWWGLVALIYLLVAYLALHGEMGSAWRARQAGAGLRWPVTSGMACMAGLTAVGLVCWLALGGRSPGRWVRVVAAAALVGVMVQGLLGGYRVYLDQLMGTHLAAVHGAFAQIVFAALAAVVVLSSPRRPGDALPDADRSRIDRPAMVLTLLVFVQLVWGVWVRHMGDPVAQRLHILTAFVIVGLCVWLAVRAVSTPAGQRLLRFDAYHLLGIVVVQVLLGVEAWMGKFAAAGPFAAIPPDLRPVTIGAAAIRTAHVVVGAGLLAAAVVFVIRIRRRPAESLYMTPGRTEQNDANIPTETATAS
jgi:cytochrome c oxidase assembly protein subunit 15